MKLNKFINISLLIVFFLLSLGIGSFLYNSIYSYKINDNFESLPLKFNADEGSSTYIFDKSDVKTYGAFIKGIQKEKDGSRSLVIRALSPLPSIYINKNVQSNLSIRIENINPELYAKSIIHTSFESSKLSANTLMIRISSKENGELEIVPLLETKEGEAFHYVILGDNRDGYDTFEEIISQVNGIKPIFAIDNGDLVFSGKANQYRLFDKSVSKLSTTLCTSLGNHDIRGNGRNTYTMLYGPAYYSFDFLDSHFIFLDSSSGWIEKQAISDQQYTWLENDLIKAQGKNIIVVTHIPPRDPRSNVSANEIPNYVNEVNNGSSWVEEKLNNYNESKSMDHGFQDKDEAEKFEALMSKYKVDTVYLSHIHSYFDYSKDGVRYLITGGAGAELLTKNSYYHYMVAKVGNSKEFSLIELPSPTNSYLSRYGATIKLFANALYEENKFSVVFSLIALVFFLGLLIIRIYLWKNNSFNKLGQWIVDTAKYSKQRFKEIFRSKHIK